MEKDKKIAAHIVGNRVIVFNHEEGTELYKNGFFGKPVGIRKPKTFDFNRPLELSLLEAYYLLEQGKIEIYDGDKKISKENFLKMVREHYENFDSKYTVYKDLRGKNFVVRPGLKFGADFGVYVHGPGIDHAPFIVHVLPNTKKISAIEMVRAGRLATSVRKKFIIATLPIPDKINYFIFTWFKP
ncbi:MAG: tRNA-intron lyase [Candidatus Helarchaeota archaeon]|nr:tRNA-intron lyase [Candidatus Helarchaeota archaeon]